MKDVEILRQSIRAVTQILTESDVRVTQQGMDAYTTCDNKTGKITQINLPYLPDDASEELIQAVQGYLDHEVGHALFTDFDVIKSVTNDSLKQLHNIVEDAFVERKMTQKFRGCAYNLGNVSSFYRARYLDKVLSGGDEEDIKRSLIVAAIRSFSGQESFTDYMSDKWHHLEGFKKAVEPLAAMLSSTKSTADCLEAAKAILEAISKKEPPTPPSNHKPDAEDEHQDDDKSTKSNEQQPEETDDNTEEDDDDSDDESETSDNDEEQDNDPSPESDSGEEDDDKDEGDDSEGEQQEESESDEESEDGDDAKSESQDDSEDESETEGADGSSEEESDDDSQNDDSPEEAEEDDDGGNGETALSELIKGGLNGNYGESLAKEVVEKAKSSEYLIYTDECDRIGMYEDIGFGRLASDKEVAKFESVVNHMMSPIQKDIERAICARSASTHVGGFRSGRLHSSTLSRLATNDDRVFRRKQVNTTKDVAVSLVIDCSGSMGGPKIKLAAYSAFTLSSVLDRLGINHEVLGFTTEQMENEVMQRARKQRDDHGVQYARYEAIVMPIFKAFGEKMSHKSKSRMASLDDGNLCSNVDGESIAIAAKRLMAQREKGKIMIVLSDGLPAVWGDICINQHLKDTVKRIEASGINTVGIGIHSKAVEGFYKKSIYVDDVDQLPSVVGKQLKNMLLGASK